MCYNINPKYNKIFYQTSKDTGLTEELDFTCHRKAGGPKSGKGDAAYFAQEPNSLVVGVLLFISIMAVLILLVLGYRKYCRKEEQTFKKTEPQDEELKKSLT